jgi:hypothetical protein
MACVLLYKYLRSASSGALLPRRVEHCSQWCCCREGRGSIVGCKLCMSDRARRRLQCEDCSRDGGGISERVWQWVGGAVRARSKRFEYAQAQAREKVRLLRAPARELKPPAVSPLR